jgi:hypothetical protein
MYVAPTTSRNLDPSKYIVQNSVTTSTLEELESTILLHLDLVI